MPPLISQWKQNKPWMTPILDIIDENDHVKTFRFIYNPPIGSLSIYPGQFVMVWVPGVDEIPMSVSEIGENGHIGITVANVGNATARLHGLHKGDLIGIRGPYGISYDIHGGTAIIVAGGTGVASLLPLIAALTRIQAQKKEPSIDRLIIIQGAKKRSDLFFEQAISQYLSEYCQIQVCTDDGSHGYRGFATDQLNLILQEEVKALKSRKSGKSAITIYACGPETMLKKCISIAEKYHVNLQASLERIMRCGFGLCGLCAMEPNGLLVCKDGPVFTLSQLKSMTNFGQSHRDLAGRPIHF